MGVYPAQPTNPFLPQTPTGTRPHMVNRQLGHSGAVARQWRCGDDSEGVSRLVGGSTAGPFPDDSWGEGGARFEHRVGGCLQVGHTHARTHPIEPQEQQTLGGQQGCGVSRLDTAPSQVPVPPPPSKATGRGQ